MVENNLCTIYASLTFQLSHVSWYIREHYAAFQYRKKKRTRVRETVQYGTFTNLGSRESLTKAKSQI